MKRLLGSCWFILVSTVTIIGLAIWLFWWLDAVDILPWTSTCMFLGIGIFVLLFVFYIADQSQLAKLPPEKREAILERRQEEREKRHEAERRIEAERYANGKYGTVSPEMICPHCQVKGHVRTKKVVRDNGVSGGKAAAAVLTGGISILATGLSSHKLSTQAFCGNCKNTWLF